MLNWLFVFHASLILMAFIIVYYAYDLQKKYPLSYLSHFFIYITAVTIYWFVAFILPSQLVHILGDRYKINEVFIYWLFIFFSFPCSLIAYYFFLSFFIKIVSKPYRPRIVIAVLLPLIVSSMGIILIFALDSSKTQHFANLYSLYRILVYAFRFGTIAFGFIASRKLLDEKRQRLIRALCLYLLSWFLFYFFIRILMPSYHRFLLDFIYPSLYLAANFPLLIIMHHYSKKTFRSYRLPNKDQLDFDWIFKRYDLTKREQEIFILLIDGKTNNEIEEELFISNKTVRNHIYNIFKKFKVNNRIQFAIFIQNMVNIK